MPHRRLTPELLTVVAERFRVLGEPARLTILRKLQDGECTVTQLVAKTGFAQANVSKHLQLLHSVGYVSRRREGLNVHYALADARIFELCNIMCDGAAEDLKKRAKAFAGR
jgi:ArsR family transcriptional regulator